MIFSVDWVQHAVGHGGFHSGRARGESGPGFNWIFDCGSRSTRKIDKLLKVWTTQNKEPVDWLFISHFDTDHVSGLNTLMSRAVVRDVMLPYVNERELAYLLLYEINRGNLDRAFIELVADPAAFFLGRGADGVTFLRSKRPGDDFIGGEPLPKGPREEQGWGTQIYPPPKKLPTPSLPGTASSRPRQVQVVDGDCTILVTRNAAALRLKPYRAPIVSSAHKGLVSDLNAIVGTAAIRKGRPGLGDLAFAIGHHARTATGRGELRRVFSSHAGSSNRSSLSLLSVPDVPNAKNREYLRRTQHSDVWGGPSSGWLNTGDAELLAPADLQDWRSTYLSHLAEVLVLSLPHHGSDKNSNEAFQNLCPRAVLVAHVKAGAKKHPGLDVTSFAGERLALVTEEHGTQVRMHFFAEL